MPSTRRRVLGVAGTALTGVAGCVAPSGGDGSGSEPLTDEPTRSPASTGSPGRSSSPDGSVAIGEELAVDGATVSVTRVAVRESFQYLDSPDSMDVASEDGVWYAFVAVEASPEGSGDLPEADDFALVVDGDGHETTTFVVDTYGVDGWGPPYDPEANGEGWIGFAVQAGSSGEDPRITLGEASWRLPDEHAARFAGPKPTFELVSFDVPDTVEARESFAATVTARNAGDVSGTFRGVLNVEGGVAAYAPYPFEFDFDVGEEASWTKEFGTDLTRPGVVMRHHLRTPAGDLDTKTEVSGTPTADGE